MSRKQTKKSFSLLMERYDKEKLTGDSERLGATQKEILSYLKAEPNLSSQFTDTHFDDKSLMLIMIQDHRWMMASTSNRLKTDIDIVMKYCQDFVDKKVISLFRLTNHLEKVRSNFTISGLDANNLEKNLKAELKLFSSEVFRDSIQNLDNAGLLETYSLGYPHTNEDKTDLTKASYLEFVLPLLPDDVLSMAVQDADIRNTFKTEIDRRALLSIGRKDNHQVKHKRKLLKAS